MVSANSRYIEEQQEQQQVDEPGARTEPQWTSEAQPLQPATVPVSGLNP